MLFLLLLGGYMLRQAIKRFSSRGPKLKIGQLGIWTVETGHLRWSKVKLMLMHVTFDQSVTTYLVIRKRKQQSQVLVKFAVDDLDVDPRSLTVYLEEFGPKLESGA
ncbi:hypothetical protein LJY25_13910 [Hymenobacter sp. BT175]|uniref:hypothetical protein n=1 Tax=Hymenobacter translucens TaxID=2886507 RepID=UPI001D0E4665|nr:hypothetical protein [Hymenobacter translucens]MCC2547547.1 hypothetical protein [Hymenobacter translucens]